MLIFALEIGADIRFIAIWIAIVDCKITKI